MNSSPTIDRKRLERYPLVTHPLWFFIFVVPVLGMLAYIQLSLSRYFAFVVESLPADASMPWIIDMMYARPLWALALGLVAGAISAWSNRSIHRSQREHDAKLYFIKLPDRLRLLRTREMRFTNRILLGRAAIGFIAFTIGCALIGMNIRIGLFSFAAGYLLVFSPELFGRHGEILRRRRIALAWEGIDPPDDTLSRGQIAYAGLFVLLVCAVVTILGFLAYWRETNLTFEGI